MNYNAIANDVFARLVQLEGKFNNASIGDEKRLYFNIALSVVRNYLNEITCKRNDVIDAYLDESKFFQEVVRVIKLDYHTEVEIDIDYKLLIDKRINSLVDELQEIKTLIKKCVKEK